LEFLLVQFIRQEREEYCPVKLIGVLDFGEGKSPLEAQVRYPLDVFIDLGEIVMNEKRTVRVIRS